MSTLPFKPWSTAIAVATTLFIWLVIPLPEGLTPNAWLMLAIFVGTIVAIIGKAMPIGAISVIAISIVAASGVTGDTPGEAISVALSSYANPLIWLIAIAIMISRGLIKTGLGARIG